MLGGVQQRDDDEEEKKRKSFLARRWCGTWYALRDKDPIKQPPVCQQLSASVSTSQHLSSCHCRFVHTPYTIHRSQTYNASVPGDASAAASGDRISIYSLAAERAVG